MKYVCPQMTSWHSQMAKASPDTARRPSAAPAKRCCSGSSARSGVRGRRRRLSSAANSRSAARSLIGSFRQKGVRPKASAPISAQRPRERTHLRSAKLLDGTHRFLCEGRICDRSRDGLRLALARDIALPPQLAVHIDETSEVREAEVIWRRGSTIGIRLRSAAPAGALRPCDRYALRERYYAIPG